jgi:hypothetical protein
MHNKKNIIFTIIVHCRSWAQINCGDSDLDQDGFGSFWFDPELWQFMGQSSRLAGKLKSELIQWTVALKRPIFLIEKRVREPMFRPISITIS